MMPHPSEGTLRAHLDGELNPESAAEVEAHLRGCRRCSAAAAGVERRAQRVEGLLATIQPVLAPEPMTNQQAHGRFAAYRQRKEEELVARNPFAKRYRPAWALAAVMLLASVALTFAPVRALAGDLLGIFRVQSIEFATVDTDTLPEREQLEALAPEIERMFGDTLAVVTEGDPRDVTDAEARDLAPFTVRLPAGAEATRHQWTPAGSVEMAIDVDELQALFRELGYTDFELPPAMDGKTLAADLSGTLASHYGACQEPTGQDCMRLIQMASPVVSVPDGLDLQQLGRIYLELLGTPAEEAAALSQRIDWSTTLVLPFPHHVNLAHEGIVVDGVEGTLIHSESGFRPAREYLLTWVKDGVIYALVGRGDHAEALELAAGLR